MRKIIYGYVNTSNTRQSGERQIKNIKKKYPQAIIVEESHGLNSSERPEWDKLYDCVRKYAAEGRDVSIVVESIVRMSENANKGYVLYEELFECGVRLVFLKEKVINTETYNQALQHNIQMTDVPRNIMTEFSKRVLLGLIKEQIRIIYEEAENEVKEMSRRTSEGIKTAKLNGKQIGRVKGKTYITKKEKRAKEIILKKSRDFGGTNTDEDLMKIIGVQRTAYYKYKNKLKAELALAERIYK